MWAQYPKVCNFLADQGRRCCCILTCWLIEISDNILLQQRLKLQCASKIRADNIILLRTMYLTDQVISKTM